MKTENKENFIIKESLLADLEYQFVLDFIRIRKNMHMSQQDMADASRIVRETIAKIENQITSPQINTLIKILAPLGYTISIIKIDNKDDLN